MKTLKLGAALVVASGFIGAAQANALDLAPYKQKVQVKPVFEKIQVSPVERSASELSPSLRAGINELSAGKNMPATKVSSWSVDKDLGIGSIIDSLIPIPIMNKIGRGAEVVYVQQFATAEEAAKAKKLCPVGVPFLCEGRSIPTNSKAAKAMRENELISFMFSKSYIVGEDGTKGLFEADVAGEGGYLLKGQFEAQVSKLDANRVRVRVLVSKGKGNQSNLDIDAPVEVFSIGTSSLGGIAISPYLKIDRQRLSGAIQITDLVFDLSNADAVKAYDVMMSEAVSIKDMLNPVPFMATDLGPVFQLVKADAARPESSRRVSLVAAMKSKFAHAHNKRDIGIEARVLGVGLKLINKKKVTNQNSITTVIDRNGNRVAAKLESNSKQSSNLQVLFGLIGSDEKRTGSTAVLNVLDEKGRPTGEIDFIVTQNLEDNKLKVKEQQEMMTLLAHRMSPAFAQRLNLATRLTGQEVKDANIYTRVVFSNAALSMLSQRSAAAYLAQSAQTYAGNGAWAQHNAEAISEMVKKLSVGLNASNSLQTRTEALTSLRSNKAFETIGTGLMMWMLGQQNLEDTVAVKLSIRAIGQADQNVQVGTLANPEALAAAQFIDDHINEYDNMVSTTALNATIIP